MGALDRDMSPGPAVINYLAENYDPAMAQDVDRVQLGNAADGWRVENHRAGQNSYNVITGAAIDNTVKLPREFANLIVTENAYSANAAVIRAWDEMVGSILNVRV